MHNELTKHDLKLMGEELEHRRLVLRPQLIDQVKEARAFGDLSENFEYKAAKQEKNHNERRIRYLEGMIRTAIVVGEGAKNGGIGLYDKVTLHLEEEDEIEVLQLVTTVRQNVLQGRISKESPAGRALWGRREGERVTIQVSDSYSYTATIQKVEPGQDDGSAELNKF